MKGKTNNPNGRPKGVPNRTTKEIKSVLNEFISMNIESMQQDFDSIDDPHLRLQFIERLFRYILPTSVKEDKSLDPKEKHEIVIKYVSSGIPLAHSESEVFEPERKRD